MSSVVSSVEKLREFYNSGQTLDCNFRIAVLKKLREVLDANEEKLLDALKVDLNKSYYEGYMTEISMISSELNYAIRNLKKWSSSKTKLSIMPVIGRFQKRYYPKGLVLIMVPFNYPLQLAVVPLIAAIAAGNTALMRFSSESSMCAQCLQTIFKGTIIEDVVTVLEGNSKNRKELFDVKYDHIFFTGSSDTGKYVMAKASENLTPVTLELGGKSPCIVADKSNVDVVAKRILFGKLTNSGQTCVAPDYLVVKSEIVDDLIKALNKEKAKMIIDYTNDDNCRIINKKALSRLESYLKDAKIVFGGNSDADKLMMELTLFIPNDLEHPAIKEEIFGPIFPLLPYNTEDELLHILSINPDPLAFYIFSKDKKFVERLLNRVRYGSAAVNDTLMQITNHHFPFGGIGNSGMGQYHGYFGFQEFSHVTTVLKRGLGFDYKQRFKPYPQDYNEIKKYMKGR